MNAPHTFTNENFREMLLFLPTIKDNKEWSERYKELMNIRVIFTEIDRNYVG